MSSRSWERRSIAAKGAQSLALRVAEVAAQAALIVVTARFLGPDGRGLYALAALTATLSVMPLGSIWSTLALDVAKRRVPSGRALATALVFAAAGGGATALVGLAVSSAFGDRWWVVAFPAAIAPVLLFLTYAQGLYQALGHVVATNGLIVARVAVPLAFLGAGVAAGGGARTLVGLWALGFVALSLPVFAHLRAVAGNPSRPPAGVRPYLRQLALAARFLPGNVSLVVNFRIALLVLAALTTTATVGVYSVAVAGAELLRLGSRAIYTSAFSAIGGRDEAASAVLTARAVRHSVLLVAVSSGVFAPASIVALPVVVGPGFGEVPELLALLVPGVLALAAFPPLAAFFGVQAARPESVTIAAVVMLAATVAGMLALVPVLGAAGAGIATSVGTALGSGYLVRRFLAATRQSPADLVPGPAELRDYAALAARARAGARRWAPSLAEVPQR